MSRRILDEDKRESLSCKGYKVVELDGFRAYAPNQEYLGAEHSPGEAWGLCVDHEEGKQMPETKELSAEDIAQQYYSLFLTAPFNYRVHMLLTAAIREAREQGANEMREKCLHIAKHRTTADEIEQEIRALPTSEEEATQESQPPAKSEYDMNSARDRFAMEYDEERKRP
jgi:hypothetical protein